MIPLFNGHLYYAAAATFLLSQVYYLYGFLPPLSVQQIIFPCEMVKYLELNFFRILTVDAKRPEKLVNDVLHFFCTLSTRGYTVHFIYMPPVLELELCMGWKCTWCFVTMNFEFIFIYVHFLKAFCYKESIKSCLLPFLCNLYCTSIKWPTSIKPLLFKVPRVAA